MQPNDCPFCQENHIFKGEVLAESTDAYLSSNPFSPGNFLIIPRRHIESLSDLPNTWWADVKTLLERVPALPDDFNVAVNHGAAAGQSLKHLHFWVIPRQVGLPASGKGLARLISEADNA